MRKYFRLAINNFQASFEYRLDVLISIAMEIMVVLSSLILWISLYKNNSIVGDFSLKDTLLYFLFLPVVSLITQADLSEELGDEIRLGGFSRFLIKPINMWGSYLVKVIANKVIRILLAFGIYIILIGFFLRYFEIAVLNFNFGLVCIFAILGFFVNFLLDMLAASFAFWFDEVWSFKHLKKIASLFLGGLAFPLSMASGNFRNVIEWLPFKFIYYVPISILNGKMNFEFAWIYFSQGIFWIIVLLLISSLIYKLGIKSYGAYGN